MSFRNILFLAAIFCVSCAHQVDLPNDAQISCLSMNHNRNSETPANMPLNFAALWELDSPAEKPLQRRLGEFKEGKIGQKAKALRLSGLTSEKIHHLMVKEGFRHQTVPLVVHPVFSPNQFWLKNGSKSQGVPKDGLGIPMEIYDHPDGSVVRLKAWGVPDKDRKVIRPQPHISKSVVFDGREHCDFWFLGCHLEVTWANEAFKVSDDGIPLPKSPAKSHGLKIPKEYSDGQKNSLIDAVMSQAHIDLPIKWMHCKKAS